MVFTELNVNPSVVITRHGVRDVLEIQSLERPSIQADEVLIEVRAAGLNFADVSARQGLYPDAPKPPCVMGYEVAGIVKEVGNKVTDFKVDDRVLAMTKFGGQASLVATRAEHCFLLPDAMSFADAAAIPVNYLTAFHMLFEIGNVKPGSTVLLHMAAGGVGTAVLQLLHTVDNVTVFGTASAPKHEYIRELGCKVPIDYRTQDYQQIVQAQTSGRGVDIVLDPLGGENWRKSWKLLAPAGRMVCFGFAGGHKGHRRNLLHVVGQLSRMLLVNPIAAMNQNKSIQGVNMGHLWSEAAMLRREMTQILALWEKGVVAPHVHACIPFSRAAEAHGLLEDRKNFGKVVLVPDQHFTE